MKPIKLIMNAFGSFLEPTEINFEILNNAGFYLITGETGSGKTTIFDAIIFSLYGEASGSTRVQEGFRNDIAEDKNKTYVEFTFEKDNTLYTIKRYPRYSVSTRSTPYPEKVELIYGDTVIEKLKNANEKILEIIGLTLEQFRQIIMLAQGEFMKLIRSSSKEKDEIFRKIFGTEMFDEIANLLKEESRTAKEKLSQVEIRILQLLESLKQNLELNYLEASFQDLHNIRYLIDELKIIIKSKTKELTNLKNTAKEYSTKQVNLIKHKEACVILNDDFDKLELLNNEIEEFEKQKDQIKEYISKIELLKKVDEIKPHYDSLITLQLQINKLISACNLNKEIVDEKQNEVNFYIDQENYIEMDKQALEKHKETFISIKKDIDLKEKINILNQDLSIVHNNLTVNEEQLLTLEKNKNFLKEEIINLTNILKDYEEIKTSYELAKVEFNKINLEFNSFNENTNLLTKRNTILTNIEKQTKEYKEILDVYQNMQNVHNLNESAYFRNIAGVLAEQLMENMPCPVCGSLNHPSPKEKEELVISKEELDAGKNKLEQMRLIVENKKVEIEKLTVKCNELNNQLLILLNIDNIKLIEKAITDTLNLYNNNIKIQKDLLNNLNIKIQQLEEVKNKLITKEEELTKLEVEINIVNNTINEIKQKVALIKGSIDSYLTQIIYKEDIEELKAAYDDYKFVISEMEEAIKAFIEGKNTANEELQNAQGKYDESYKQLEEAKSSHAVITNKYFTLIKELNLSSEVIDNLEDYINELPKMVLYTKRITEYETKYQNTLNTVSELKTKLKDKKKENIDSLVEQLNLLEKEIIILNEKINELDKELSNNTDIYKELEKMYKIYLTTYDEYIEISELNKTANGNNPKYLSFERFVLIEYFENILKHANIRLNKMTDGRFVLYRKEDKGKGMGQQGLDLEVFDFETGKRRDVKTLSGGETFKAALSLALGLADAIENKVGHISIETLFIDEGFGTLDDKSLHQAIDILLDLNDGTKSIGIISHVQELKELIPTKLIVTKKDSTSKVEIIE